MPGIKLSPTATGDVVDDDGFLRKAFGRILFSSLILSDGLGNLTPDMQSSMSSTSSSHPVGGGEVASVSGQDDILQ